MECYFQNKIGRSINFIIKNYKLKKCNFSGSRITDKEIKEVNKYQNNIVNLDLSDCHYITNKSIHLLNGYYNIKLNFYYRIDDTRLSSLYNCYQITDFSVKKINKYHDIILYCCSYVTDASISCFMQLL